MAFVGSEVQRLQVRGEDHGEELFVGDVDSAGPVGVGARERLGQHVKHDAALDEVVEVDLAFLGSVKLLHEDVEEGVAESVSEGGEGVLELSSVDAVGLGLVEVPEGHLPVRHILPQVSEAVEVDGLRLGGVEHAYHEAHGLRVEGRPVAIGEGRLELCGIDGSTVVLVHPLKDLLQIVSVDRSAVTTHVS